MDRRTVLGIAAAAVGLAAAGCDDPVATPGNQRPSGQEGQAGTSSASAPGASPATSAGRVLGPLPAEVTRGPADRPNVALTFHGQGSPQQVTQLLSELERGGARVTVLAVGSWLQAQPAMAKRILDGGHELGNHTQNHRAIAQMAAAAAYAEVNECAQVLKRLTGSIGTWFRPSQTEHATPGIRAQAVAVGYPTVLSYDLDSRDFTDPGAAAIVHTILGGVANGSIVSMHCGHNGTIAAIAEVLDGLAAKGLRAVTMTELMTS